MHDQTPESLRKQALKHGSKTVSKKALSKQSSLTSSRINSRANSAVASRNASAANSRAGSDVGSNSLSEEDSRPTSPNGIDALIAEEEEPTDESWQEHLADVIKNIEDRNWKTSNVQTRKEALVAYVGLLRQHYCPDDVGFRLTQLTSAFVKCIKAEDDTTETVLALKALAVTMVTCPSSDIYEDILSSVKRTIIDSSDLKVKTEAIQTFAIASFYGDVSDDELLSNLDFLLEIISSDGQYIDALDEPEPVAAALAAYGFLATLVDDLSTISAEALEVFTDQLDSGSAAVLIAAGENIALLYEKAHTPLEEDEAVDETSPDILAIEDANGKNTSYFVRRYPLAPNQAQLETRLSALQSQSGKSLSRDAKRSLHSSFADILHSVQHPTHGPRFSTTIDPDTGRAAGSSLKLRVAGEKGKGLASATIDKWWQLHRHRVLKEVLGNGFMVHYELNEGIFEALPIVFVESRKSGKKRVANRGRSQFLEVEDS